MTSSLLIHQIGAHADQIIKKAWRDFFRVSLMTMERLSGPHRIRTELTDGAA